jgi:hypothetical protein
VVSLHRLILDGVGRCTGATIISLISRVVLTGHSLVILNFTDRLINNRINVVCTTAPHYGQACCHWSCFEALRTVKNKDSTVSVNVVFRANDDK